MAPALANLRGRAIAWAERRLPALTRLRRREALPIRLDRRRIYVLPTGFGLLFGVLLFVMLVGALNYGNNAAVLLTCVLAATCGASLFAGFRCMSGLVLTGVRADEAQAGSPRWLRLRFDAAGRARHALRIGDSRSDRVFDLGSGDATEIALELPPTPRGWHSTGRLRIWTDYPLGLFRAWSWINPDLEFLVYPDPESPEPPLPLGSGRSGEHPRAGASEDLAGLREYRPSDPRRLIAWKPSVRHDSLLVRDVERRSGEALELSFTRLRGLDAEGRIRRLAAWVAAAEREQRGYVLDVPGSRLGPASGAAHRAECLRALATLPGPEMP